MSQFLLSVHVEEGVVQGPTTPEQVQVFMERVNALEADMSASGTFVFGGHLTEPSDAKVVRRADTGLSMTDGPYAEAKEHIGGFYIIEAPDLDAALDWARKVVEAIEAPIEVRPFSDASRG